MLIKRRRETPARVDHIPYNYESYIVCNKLKQLREIFNFMLCRSIQIPQCDFKTACFAAVNLLPRMFLWAYMSSSSVVLVSSAVETPAGLLQEERA